MLWRRKNDVDDVRETIARCAVAGYVGPADGLGWPLSVRYSSPSRPRRLIIAASEMNAARQKDVMLGRKGRDAMENDGKGGKDGVNKKPKRRRQSDGTGLWLLCWDGATTL